MTKDQRIRELEAKVAMLQAQVTSLETRLNSMFQPYQLIQPQPCSQYGAGQGPTCLSKGENFCPY